MFENLLLHTSTFGRFTFWPVGVSIMVVYSSKGEFLLRINAEIEGLGMLTSMVKFAVYGNDG